MYQYVSLEMREEEASNSPAVWALRLIGLWYPKKSHKYYKMYHIYSIVGYFMYIVHVTTMAIHVCQIYQDIEALSASIYILTIKLIGAYKVIYLMKGMEFSQNLVYAMNRKIFQPKCSRQDNLEKSLFWWWKIRTYFLLFCVANTVIFLNVSPLIDGISKKKLAFAAWFPFNTGISPIYEAVYVFQLLLSTYAGFINVGTDVFASQILTNICIQCSLLSDTLRNLQEYCKRDLKFPNMSKQNVLNNMNRALLKSVKHHKAILRYAKDAEGLFNSGVFLQFSASCIIMCLNLLQMSWLDPRSGEFLALSVYQITVIMTLLTYCWYGNEVMFSSMQIPFAAYECPWFNCNTEFRKNLQFFILRTQKPIIIYTLNFFPVYLQTFISILRSSYSYYAVLRTVHEPGGR